MSSRWIVTSLCLGFCAMPLSTAAGPIEDSSSPSLAERARGGLLRAGRYWTRTVAAHGGFVWEYTTDLVTRRRGESGDLTPDTQWVQPPGTPSVGMALLEAYAATGEKSLLDGALAAAHCLAWGQLASGGWDYRIDFDLSRNRNRYHHLDPDEAGGASRLRDTSTFDDDTTQSATRFLVEIDRYVDDPRVSAAVQRALQLFLKAQYRGGPWDGAWPQRFPPPSSGYGRYPTFNDNTMSDCVRTMLLAYRCYGKEEYLDSVKRCLEFYLRAQLPPPQAAWAQQYDEELKPAWARKFEPPAVSGGESSGNMELLMDMYAELGDPRYLDAVGRAVDWYRCSRIGGTDRSGRWARFYEVGSNRPLYFTRTYELVYTDDDLPVHYSFQGDYGVDARIRRYEALRGNKPEAPSRKRGADESSARRVLEELDEQGRWVRTVARREQVRDAEGRVGYEVDESTRLSMMYSREFCENMRVLSGYLIALRGGPAVRPLAVESTEGQRP